MQEQQPTPVAEGGMATPTDAPSTMTAGGNAPTLKPMKKNRRQRRFEAVVMRRQQKKAQASSVRRLDNFKVLNATLDSLLGKSKVTTEQKESIFRVALNSLFKKDFKNQLEFERKLSAVVRNVKSGFKYKADVAPPVMAENVAPQPIATEAPPNEG